MQYSIILCYWNDRLYDYTQICLVFQLPTHINQGSSEKQNWTNRMNTVYMDVCVGEEGMASHDYRGRQVCSQQARNREEPTMQF